MSGRLLDADPCRFPLNGSYIHRQDGWSDQVAVGPEEIGKLPKPQRKGVVNLLNKTPIDARLVGFLDSGNGDIHLTTGGSPVAATVDKKGEITSYVEWIK